MDRNLKDLVKFSYRVLSVRMNKRFISFSLKGYFINPEGLRIENPYIAVTKSNQFPVEINEFKKKLSPKDAFFKNKTIRIKVKTEDIVSDETGINNHIRVKAMVEGRELPFNIAVPVRKKNFNKRYYYAPFKGTFKGNYAIHFRREGNGALILVKRPRDEYERTARYHFFENSLVSGFLYVVGKTIRKFSKKRVALFFEKDSSKAEEGAFELFEKVRDHSKTQAYFIIDEKSRDYSRIIGQKNVVRRYSAKYYWLMYRVNVYIATEAPSHLNVLRSNNKWFRRMNVSTKFVFLQHGVTYMKSQSKKSTFVKGKEGAVDYIVADSEKEKQVLCRMLKVPEKNVIQSGMAIFSKMDYQNITQSSKDIVTIMLTWKPYEEHVFDFSKTQYYAQVVQLYEMLSRYMPEENIYFVAHPKVVPLIKGTRLYERMWKKTIFELLQITKLLITDYSSVCYLSFYRGAGVIFYQYDLEEFEQCAGKLIPESEEYIGPRVFKMEDLEHVIADITAEKTVDLSKVRTEEYQKRFDAIVEFHDGKNIERIFQALKEKKLI